MTDDQTPRKKGLMAKLFGPAGSISIFALLTIGIGMGVIGWGGFNWGMELTNTETFCVTCHEMADTPYQEYAGSVHDTNASGVRATCPDCHVPRPWVHKMKRKIEASKELWYHFTNKLPTPEAYEEHRLEMASKVWKTMKETDSRECRNCHNFNSMDVAVQGPRARRRHLEGAEDGMTCIDCHKGIAHELPKGAFSAEMELNETWNAVHRE